MARLSQEIILDMAEKIIYEKGMEKTTLYDIAGNLNVTHAALYKHYRNKEDLFQKLALRWLEETSREIFAWNSAAGQSPDDALHDWLWLLAGTKKKLYATDRKMFLLYTDYIEQNEALVKNHVEHLAQKAEEVSGRKEQGAAIITAFIYFHNPYFANRWEQEGHEELFERVWQLVK
ncbi:TetR/AcrR family transcriptional regulator [Listeria sp. FSL L7-0233]|uniref:TetR/AcrR family transcriptional regulator n=1 Tax=Listeria cossartiae TaxID=2838249 RepID=UPI0016243440|nr:TetR family transcriptional regulator [Listeria cossartiae]MCD2247945.1 TetR/AcrR family transcriptional regulator [Listeria marthii]MBC1547260.1 TetR/AcrR family transcriptional regulator [Listeria cossartiae subsp. cossartiae]MBC1571628.1 TetR/AcrR family transcriptional regulator [Listeria cossartiae subsp. cossartiae]MBC1987290.1 TetR/AcrR family transcriptional regulator [Listeria cossartiae subsp. cossartiae]MBC2183909.1 TetR/AcrR family transcriptional regulator [Listeria cossartiae 